MADEIHFNKTKQIWRNQKDLIFQFWLQVENFSSSTWDLTSMVSNGKKEEEQESSLSTLIQISFLLVIGMAVIGSRHILVAQSKEQEHKEVDSAKQRNEPVESLQVIPI